MVVGDNASDADNQQERPGYAQWVVGFVDGEGCFSVPFSRNATCRSGWQVQPTFTVVQGERSVHVLYELQRFFGCGHVGRNGRHDNHREDMWRYCVRCLEDLLVRIIPFFEENPLMTAKSADFVRFASVVRLMRESVNLTVAGLEQIAELAESINRRRPRILESSEAIRQPSRLDGRDEDMVLAPRRRGDRPERNSLSGKKLPSTGAIPCETPLITAKPSPAVSTKDETMAGG
jgi:hypothetical protein